MGNKNQIIIYQTDDELNRDSTCVKIAQVQYQ